VRVAIYADRVEIRNPGSLPEGLTVERMRQGHIARRRNPLVADLLRHVHLVEAWGRGMPLILEKAPHVEFEDVAGIFIARFARPPATVQDTAAKRRGKRRGKYWPPFVMTNRRPFQRCRP
jgi:ATP-dependent DNA helicase RecG